MDRRIYVPHPRTRVLGDRACIGVASKLRSARRRTVPSRCVGSTSSSSTRTTSCFRAQPMRSRVCSTRIRRCRSFTQGTSRGRISLAGNRRMFRRRTIRLHPRCSRRTRACSRARFSSDGGIRRYAQNRRLRPRLKLAEVGAVPQFGVLYRYRIHGANVAREGETGREPPSRHRECASKARPRSAVVVPDPVRSRGASCFGLGNKS